MSERADDPVSDDATGDVTGDASDGAGRRGFPWSDPCEGLPLRVATSPEWAGVALGDLGAVLVDHAYCEHKAATTSLRMIGRFPDHPELVRPLLGVAQEELEHFRAVVGLIEERGLTLGSPRPDRYVRALRLRFCSEGEGLGGSGDLLLVNAFVEARSCERFRLLAEALHGSGVAGADAALASFYARLAESEGRHWQLFYHLAELLQPPEKVRKRLDEVAAMEADVVRGLPIEPRMH